MGWNWEQPEWPSFRWDAARLADAEAHFLVEAGVVLGTVRHLGEADREQLLVERMSGEALTTSRIEGEVLDRASVQASIQRQLGLQASQRHIAPAEQGIAEMMVDLYRSFAEPLTDETLWNWHRMLTNGRRDLKDIGRYRSSDEPMQIISGPYGAEKTHFEAPPSARVPGEMARFIRWFNTEPGLPALTRAGIAHLYFESIHPFEDGNGRIGRAIAEKALAQSIGKPILVALATAMLARQKSYYQALEEASATLEITPWLMCFADTALAAQQESLKEIEFVVAKTKMLDRLRGQINERQEKALVRMFREGPKGFEGGMSAGNYGTITGASPATTTRDLADLVEKGALVRTGERRHARYALEIGGDSR
jgi:Fic family protein